MQKQTSYRLPGKLSTIQVTLLGIILGLRIVLSFLPSLDFGKLVQIGVGFVGTALSGILFGPWYALIVSIANDLITAMLHGKQFFLGFTLSAAVGGLLYGLFLWRKPTSLKQIALAVLAVTLIVNIGMNSIWIRMMYGKAWSVFMPMRIIKNLISFPLNTAILYFLFNIPTIKKFIQRYQF